MTEVETVEQVLDVLLDIGAKRIGVDGTDGAGKSHLAARIAHRLAARHLDLDDFLVKNQGGFVDHIKYSELRSNATGEMFVVSGVCLLDVLAKAGIGIDALIYVKRYHLGYWSDERELDLSEPLEDFLAKERELVSLIAGEGTGHLGLGEEIIRYHYHCRPHNHANVIFRRNDG